MYSCFITPLIHEDIVGTQKGINLLKSGWINGAIVGSLSSWCTLEVHLQCF